MDFALDPELENIRHEARRLADRFDDDPVTQFATLRIARDMAMQLGAAEASLQIVDHLGRRFDIDMLRMKVDILEKLDGVQRFPSQKAKNSFSSETRFYLSIFSSIIGLSTCQNH